jgi:type IV secretory pathway TraG/TraD family ATPase VirD4
LDVGRVFHDSGFRKSLLEKVPDDSSIKARWTTFSEAKKDWQAEVSTWAASKFAELEKSAVLECVLAAQPASFSLRDCIHGGGIFIARLPEGIIGTRAASFLGSLFVSRIGRHITERPAVSSDSRGYYLYVDEFQKFVGHEFQQLIPEARKYRLGITLAHQNIDQLRAFDRYSGVTESAVLTQVLGNVGTIIAFRMAHKDAERIGQELGLTTRELLRIRRFEAVVRTVRADAETDPVTVAVPDALEDPGYPAARRRISESLRATGVIRSRAALLGVELTDDMLVIPKTLES